MSSGEFALITELRDALGQERPGDGTLIGIGDDAAVLDCGGRSLVACTDTLVAGRHFFADVNAADLAWKALAVNLSDLAAMAPNRAGPCSIWLCRLGWRRLPGVPTLCVAGRSLHLRLSCVWWAAIRWPAMGR